MYQIHLKRYNDLPVILMTGKSDTNNEKSKYDGLSDNMAKPVSFASIISIIGEDESCEVSFG